MIHFFKKNWSTILFVAAVVLLLIPQTSMPIKVFVSRLFALSPSEINADERTVLNTYEWNLSTTGGERVNFSQSEGKVVLVNLWATWCPPCVAEMPSLQKLYDVYGDKVDFYFVSSEAPLTIEKFIQKKGYTFPVFIETQSPPKDLLTQTIPTTYLISKEGRIIIHETGAANWDSDEVNTILDSLLIQ
jgi:thiol-disulfide isomerase/thioredoxin